MRRRLVRASSGVDRMNAAADDLAVKLQALVTLAREDLWPRIEEVLASVPIALIALDRIALAWSGSNIGPHSLMYYSDLEPPPAGRHWDADWGFIQPQAGWHQRADHELEAVVSTAIGGAFAELALRADALDLHTDEMRHAATLVMDRASEQVNRNATLQQRHQDLVDLPSALTVGSILQGWMPRGMVTRDMPSLARGLVAAPHQRLRAQALRAESIAQRASELIRRTERATATADSARGPDELASRDPSRRRRRGRPAWDAELFHERYREAAALSPKPHTGPMVAVHFRPLHYDAAIGPGVDPSYLNDLIRRFGIPPEINPR